MHDLLNGTVDMDTVNKHYWKLLEQHAGIEPPTDRTEGAIDFPYKFYVNIEQNYQTKYLIYPSISCLISYVFTCFTENSYPKFLAISSIARSARRAIIVVSFTTAISLAISQLAIA